MTAADPTNGAGTWWLTRTQAKALGFIPDDMSDDGTTIFGAGNPFTFSGAIAAGTFDFQGVVAHEISEVMGRLGLSGGTVKTSDGGLVDNSFSLIDNFSYTAPGTKGLRSGPRNHFSIDNGTTLLKLWNDPTADEGDSRDWAPGTNDAFNQVSLLGVADPVSAVDVQLMDVIGYDARKLFQYYTLARPGSAAPAGAITSVFKGGDVMEVWWVGADGSVQAAYHEGSWQYYTLAGPGSAAPAGAITSVFKGGDVMEVWWVAPDGSVQAAYHEGSWQHYTLAGPGSAAPAGGYHQRVQGRRCHGGVVGRPGRFGPGRLSRGLVAAVHPCGAGQRRSGRRLSPACSRAEMSWRCGGSARTVRSRPPITRARGSTTPLRGRAAPLRQAAITSVFKGGRCHGGVVGRRGRFGPGRLPRGPVAVLHPCGAGQRRSGRRYHQRVQGRQMSWRCGGSPRTVRSRPPTTRARGSTTPLRGRAAPLRQALSPACSRAEMSWRCGGSPRTVRSRPPITKIEEFFVSRAPSASTCGNAPWLPRSPRPGPGLPGFDAPGQIGQCLADVPEPAADPRGGQQAGRAGPLPGQPQVGGQAPGEAELGIAGDDQPGPPVGGGRVPELRPGPAQDLLDEPERVLKEQARLHTLAGGRAGGSSTLPGGRGRACSVSARWRGRAASGGCAGIRGGPGRGSGGRAGRAAARAGGCRRRDRGRGGAGRSRR